MSTSVSLRCTAHCGQNFPVGTHWGARPLEDQAGGNLVQHVPRGKFVVGSARRVDGHRRVAGVAYVAVPVLYACGEPLGQVRCGLTVGMDTELIAAVGGL